MELSKMTLDDLYELVKSTLWGWNIKKNEKDVLMELGDADSDKYIEMNIRKCGKKVEVTFILYSGDETYFNEEKPFDNSDDLVTSLTRIDHLSNMTIDEILTETNYTELRGTYKEIL